MWNRNSRDARGVAGVVNDSRSNPKYARSGVEMSGAIIQGIQLRVAVSSLSLKARGDSEEPPQVHLLRCWKRLC